MLIINETKESKSKWAVALKQHVISERLDLTHTFEIITVLPAEHHLLVPHVKSSRKFCQVKAILQSVHHRHNRSLALKTEATHRGCVCSEVFVASRIPVLTEPPAFLICPRPPPFIETPSILDL